MQEKTAAIDPDLQSPTRTYNVTKADARPVLSVHHEISFDDKKVLVPWEEGKTSYLWAVRRGSMRGYALTEVI